MGDQMGTSSVRLMFRYMKSLSSSAYLSRSRWALYIGFGSLIVIMAVSSLDALRVLHQYGRAHDEIRERFLFRNRTLNNIRSEVYLSGTYVRDYLLDPEPVQAENFRTNLEEVHRKMDHELEAYAKQLLPSEGKGYDALQSDLIAYWAVIQPTLQWNADERKNHGYIFLRDEVYPRRAAMLEVAGRIADLNEEQLNSANAEASDLLNAFQTRTALVLILGLTLGLGMAAFTIRRILSLERRADARYKEIAGARQQLAGLSARLVEAQESERRSLSRELHDEVGQSLSAVLVELRNLSAVLPNSPDNQARQQAEIIKGQVEATVRVVRNMALLLRPSMLDDLGLIPALKWQAREVSKQTNLDVTLTTELESEDLPDEHKTCVYRIVQEGLHNCSRHAQATSVHIRVHRRKGSLSLRIEDNGRGFDAQRSKGLGLLGMEERAVQLGGTFRASSIAGIGTILSVELPLPDQIDDVLKEYDGADSHTVSG
jgi:signal transduction histidine kinase